MKESEIKFRIDKELKQDFIDICEYENIGMSNKLVDFISTEVKTKKIELLETKITTIFSDFGYSNVTVIDSPAFVINDEGNLISNSSEGHSMLVYTYKSTLIDFLRDNEDKKIFLYLEGCDLKANHIRATAI